MYNRLNIYSNLLDSARIFIKENDRALFIPFMKTIEEFCAANEILIGGNNGIKLIMKQTCEIGDYSYDLYSESAHKHARELTNALFKTDAPHIPKITIHMNTNIPNKEFTIYVDHRQLVKIYSLDEYRGVSIYKLIDKIETEGWFTKTQCKVMGPEMFLINIYHKLYLPYAKVPGGYTTYSEYLDRERVVFDLIKTYPEKSLRENNVVGAEDYVNMDQYTGGLDYGEITGCGYEDLMDLTNKIYNAASECNAIVSGDYAAEYYLGEKIPNKRLEFLGDIDIIIPIVKRIAESEGYKNIKVVQFNVLLSNDFRLQKRTIYIIDGEKQTPLMDIFNSPTYELIPYIKYRGHMIANIYVTMRFKFISLWLLSIISNLHPQQNLVNKQHKPNFMIIKTIELISKIREKIEEMKPKELFQLTDYAGIYKNEAVAKTQIIMSQKTRIAPYYPEKSTY